MLSRILFATALLTLSSAIYAAESPYAGQQTRTIKALSQQQIQDYQAGKGMGYAKAAELNHYPGPRHVLDMAAELKLSATQIEKSQALFNDMQSKASALGKQLVNKEAELDKLFASAKISPVELQKRLDEIAAISGKLRYVHLNAHLTQQAMLSPQQLMRYDHLRGYSGGDHAHAQQHGNHHH